jgi:predicted GNAT family acetyltransferase
VWEIRAERDESRYSAFLEGKRVGHAAWIRLGEATVVPHVRVDRAHQGIGIDSELVRCICRDARADGLRVLAHCKYVRHWARLHPQYRDVLRVPGPGEADAIARFVEEAELREERSLGLAEAG